MPCGDLIDHDGDGLLDEEEMKRVAFMVVSPVQVALVKLFQDALDAYPVCSRLLEIENEASTDGVKGAQPQPSPQRQGLDVTLQGVTNLETTIEHVLKNLQESLRR